VTGVIVDELRARARTWLAAHAPRHRTGSDAWAARVAPLTAEQERAAVARARDFQAALFDAGLAGITWPRSCGGQGLTLLHQIAFDEEAEGFELPSGYYFHVGHGMCGPTILAHGTPEQQARYPRPLLRGDEIWCQLFSEPGAGSDLASLQTRAVRDGDHWVVSGQKVWSSGAHLAQFGLLLARTDPEAPKHRGLTMFVVDMGSTGVTTRPLRQMSGAANFNEVFLDDVRVPDDHRLGPLHAGWQVSLTTLTNERVAIGAARAEADQIDSLVELACDLGRSRDAVVRDRLASLHIHRRLIDYLSERIRTAVVSGGSPGPEGSVLKLATTRLAKDVAALGAELAGAGATAWPPGNGRAIGRGNPWVDLLLASPGRSIGGGTDEVQKNVVAERVLGLPKEPTG
jgi:alkylation response protein AidB-like acyl-CoA dehydrogenase